MTKKSGYQVTLSLFIEAAPFDAEALSLAKARIQALPALIENQGFIVIDVVDKPRNRMEVPEPVKVLIAQHTEERNAGKDDLDAGLKSAGLDRRPA